MGKKQILLIDDHPLVNFALASWLEETELYTVCAELTTLAEAQKFIKEAKNLPALIILDIMLGEENGLDLLPFLKKFCLTKKIPKPPVLVCSVMEDSFRIQTALKLGAEGYASKGGTKEDLLDAVEAMLRGEKYVMDGCMAKLEETSDIFSQFTKKELEVMHLVKQSKTNQEISQILGISIRTVENHVSNIYFKTGLESRSELIQL